MAISRAKKEEVVSKIGNISESAQSIAFVNFHGLSVGEISAMRGDLLDKEIGYYVAKKSLISRALEGKFSGEKPTLSGEIALVWSDIDATSAPREVYAYQQKYGNRVSLVAGVFEDSYRDQAAITEIAQIPSLHVLRGMFVNVINSPIQGLAMVVKAIAEKKEA